ncbi:hypothetical protein Scep_008538 [Stephania cephalantha]|uniref:Fe2OG dioxygenase domain-containing protein n=1 Tax=Stephania cephalantha TaxID=152367 RepID=A0AAP0KBW3_9MAGN
MGSLEFPIGPPVVNFCKQDLKPGTSQWDYLKYQVKHALEEYGCFKVVYDKVPLDFRNDVFDGLKELFNLPTETKHRISYGRAFNSYLTSPQPTLFESIGVEDADVFEMAQSFTNTLWPEGNPNFCKTFNSYAKQISEIDHAVRRMVLEMFGVEKYYDEHFESSCKVLRLMKYKAPETNEKRVGIESHTDEGIVTVIHQNQISGLEIQSKDGEWISVELSPRSFFVIIGDVLMGWTNGRLRAPQHRVCVREYNDRYSLALFSMPKPGSIVKAPEELVDEEHPLQFKPFEYDKFYEFLCSDVGLNSQSFLKDFCGA